MRRRAAGDNLHAVAQAVPREVDAGFVYATDAQAMSERVQRAFQVPVAGGISYPLAMVKTSRNAAEAKRFIAFVRSAQGQAILHRHGFGSP